MGKKQSMKYATKKGSLKGITDNHSVKAYNRWCKKFVEWAAEQGVTHFEDLPTEKERIDFVQKYQIYLDNTKGYAPSTVISPQYVNQWGFPWQESKRKGEQPGISKGHETH